MKDSWFIIVNPRAGKREMVNTVDRLSSALRAAGFNFHFAWSEHQGHITALVKEAIAQGYRNLIALGGDGTNNEIINGIVTQSTVSSTDIRYALYPCGTGNDWAKSYAIPKDIDAWVDMLKRCICFRQDLGLVKYEQHGRTLKRYFTNVAGMSYDAYVVRQMSSKNAWINNRLGYLIYGLYYVFKYVVPKAIVTVNGKQHQGHYYLINAGINRYSGGGMQLVPHAVPDDGKLAITLAGHLSKLAVLLNSYRFYDGSIADHPKVQTLKASSLKVQHVNTPVLLEVDGEYIGTSPVEFSVLPRALQVIIPSRSDK